MAQWFDLSEHRLSVWLDNATPKNLLIFPLSDKADPIMLSELQKSLFADKGASIDLGDRGEVKKVTLPVTTGLPGMDWWKSAFPLVTTQDMSQMAVPVVYSDMIPSDLRAQWLWSIPKNVALETGIVNGNPNIHPISVFTTSKRIADEVLAGQSTPYVSLTDLRDIQLLGPLQSSGTALSFWSTSRALYESLSEAEQQQLHVSALGLDVPTGPEDERVSQALLILSNSEGFAEQFRNTLVQLSPADYAKSMSVFVEEYNDARIQDVMANTGLQLDEVANILTSQILPTYEKVFTDVDIQDQFSVARIAAQIIERDCGTPASVVHALRSNRKQQSNTQGSAWESWRNIRLFASEMGLNAAIDKGAFEQLNLDSYVESEGVSGDGSLLVVNYTDSQDNPVGILTHIDLETGLTISSFNKEVPPGRNRTTFSEEQYEDLNACFEQHGRMVRGETLLWGNASSASVQEEGGNPESATDPQAVEVAFPYSDDIPDVIYAYQRVKHAFKLNRALSDLDITKHQGQNIIRYNDTVVGVFTGRRSKDVIMEALSKRLLSYIPQLSAYIRSTIMDDVNALMERAGKHPITDQSVTPLLEIVDGFAVGDIPTNMCHKMTIASEENNFSFKVDLNFNDAEVRAFYSMERRGGKETFSKTTDRSKFGRLANATALNDVRREVLAKLASLIEVDEAVALDVITSRLGDSHLNHNAAPPGDVTISTDGDQEKDAIQSLIYSTNHDDVVLGMWATQFVAVDGLDSRCGESFLQQLEVEEAKRAFNDIIQSATTFEEIVDKFQRYVMAQGVEFDLVDISVDRAVNVAESLNLSDEVLSLLDEAKSRAQDDDPLASTPKQPSASEAGSRVRADAGEFIPYARKHLSVNGIWGASDSLKIESLASLSNGASKADVQAARTIARKPKLDTEWPKYTPERKLELYRNGVHPLAVEVQSRLREGLKEGTSDIVPGNSRDAKWYKPNQWIALGLSYQTHVRSLKARADQIRTIEDVRDFFKEQFIKDSDLTEEQKSLKQDLLPTGWYLYTNYSDETESLETMLTRLKKHENAIAKLPINQLGFREFGALDTNIGHFQRPIISSYFVNRTSEDGSSIVDLDGSLGEKARGFLNNAYMAITRSNSLKYEYERVVGNSSYSGFHDFLDKRKIESFIGLLEDKSGDTGFWLNGHAQWKSVVADVVDPLLKSKEQEKGDGSRLAKQVQTHLDLIQLEPSDMSPDIQEALEVKEKYAITALPSFKKPAPRFANLKRTGPDRRVGDVEETELLSRFGIRGIQYGEYVNQQERQAMLNLAYDSLEDMASALGVPPKFMGFNGVLGLAFGARGRGKAAAHYEPDLEVINLTKTMGSGALAHEMAHFFDHQIAKSLSCDQSLQQFTSGRYATHALSSALDSSPSATWRIQTPEASSDATIIEASVLRSQIGLMKNFVALMKDPFLDDDTKKMLLEKNRKLDTESFKSTVLYPMMLSKETLEYASSSLQWSGEHSSLKGKSESEVEITFMKIASSWRERIEPFMSKLVDARNEGLSEFSSIFSNLKGRTHMYCPDTFKSSIVSIMEDTDKPLTDTEIEFASAWIRKLEYKTFKKMFLIVRDEGKGAVSMDSNASSFFNASLLLDGKKTKPYWHTAIEIWARGFSAVIHDEAKKQGVENDFASAYSAPKWGESRDFIASPNPEGVERKLMIESAAPFLMSLQAFAQKVCNTEFTSEQSDLYKGRLIACLAKLKKSLSNGASLDALVKDLDQAIYLGSLDESTKPALVESLLEMLTYDDANSSNMEASTKRFNERIQIIESALHAKVFPNGNALVLLECFEQDDMNSTIQVLLNPIRDNRKLLSTKRSMAAAHLADALRGAGRMPGVLESIVDAWKSDYQNTSLHQYFYNMGLAISESDYLKEAFFNDEKAPLSCYRYFMRDAYNLGAKESDIQRSLNVVMSSPNVTMNDVSSVLGRVIKAQQNDSWGNVALPTPDHLLDNIIHKIKPDSESGSLADILIITKLPGFNAGHLMACEPYISESEYAFYIERLLPRRDETKWTSADVKAMVLPGQAKAFVEFLEKRDEYRPYSNGYVLSEVIRDTFHDQMMEDDPLSDQAKNGGLVLDA